jgi:hypothetical protein
MRKAVETMSKRVDKHFTDEDEWTPHADSSLELIQSVWKEFTEELKRETGGASRDVGDCYSESGLGLEIGIGDVDTCCK